MWAPRSLANSNAGAGVSDKLEKTCQAQRYFSPSCDVFALIALAYPSIHLASLKSSFEAGRCKTKLVTHVPYHPWQECQERVGVLTRKLLRRKLKVKLLGNDCAWPTSGFLAPEWKARKLTWKIFESDFQYDRDWSQFKLVKKMQGHAWSLLPGNTFLPQEQTRAWKLTLLALLSYLDMHLPSLYSSFETRRKLLTHINRSEVRWLYLT